VSISIDDCCREVLEKAARNPLSLTSERDLVFSLIAGLRRTCPGSVPFQSPETARFTAVDGELPHRVVPELGMAGTRNKRIDILVFREGMERPVELHRHDNGCRAFKSNISPFAISSAVEALIEVKWQSGLYVKNLQTDPRIGWIDDLLKLYSLVTSAQRRLAIGLDSLPICRVVAADPALPSGAIGYQKSTRRSWLQGRAQYFQESSVDPMSFDLTAESWGRGDESRSNCCIPWPLVARSEFSVRVRSVDGGLFDLDLSPAIDGKRRDSRFRLWSHAVKRGIGLASILYSTGAADRTGATNEKVSIGCVPAEIVVEGWDVAITPVVPPKVR